VAIADIVAGWPQGLQALVHVAVVGAETDERGRVVMKGEGATAEGLVRDEMPLKLSLDRSYYMQRAKVSNSVMHGICAVLWARPWEATLHLDLSYCNVGVEGLVALARATNHVLAALKLKNTNCANKGSDNSGIRHLCDALSAGFAPGLTAVDLSGNALDVEAARLIAVSLKGSAIRELK